MKEKNMSVPPFIFATSAQTPRTYRVSVKSGALSRSKAINPRSMVCVRYVRIMKMMILMMMMIIIIIIIIINNP